jgi:hypothetical protein
MQASVVGGEVHRLLQIVEGFANQPRVEMNGPQVAVQNGPVGCQLERPHEAAMRLGVVETVVPDQTQEVPTVGLTGIESDLVPQQPLGLFQIAQVAQPRGLAENSRRSVHVTHPEESSQSVRPARGPATGEFGAEGRNYREHRRLSLPRFLRGDVYVCALVGWIARDCRASRAGGETRQTDSWGILGGPIGFVRSIRTGRGPVPIRLRPGFSRARFGLKV